MIVEFTYTIADLKEAGRAHFNARRRGFVARWAGVREWLGWGLFVGMIATLLVLLERGNRIQSTPPIVAPPNQSPWMFILPIIPLMLGVVVLRFLLSWYAPLIAAQRAWYGDPAIQLRRTLDVDSSRFILDDGQTRIERKWKSFRRFIETQNLILLCPSDLRFDIVPKRAFTSPQQLDEFRGLLNEQVHPPTGGFPVQPPPTS